MTPEFKAAVTDAMTRLGQDDRVLFVGQQVAYTGHVIYETIEGVPMAKRLEFPVAEEFQTGFCTGLALQGYIPVSCYPRMDFILCAANQLVNHLDKLAEMTVGRFAPVVILRTMKGSISPLNPGPQHSQDHTAAFRLLLKHIPVDVLTEPEQVWPVYKAALKSSNPTLVIEAG